MNFVLTSPPPRTPMFGLAASLLCACGGAPTVRAPVPHPLEATVDRIVASVFSEMPMVGATIAIERNGQLFVKAYGKASLELDAATTSDTVYCIGSISKQFGAAAVLALVEDGKLALDDDVVKWLPEVAAPDGPITVRDLLRHTSGIQDFEYHGPWPKTMALRRSDAEVASSVRDLPRLFPPGKRFSYSTTNYVLLGLIVEKATGQPMRKFVRERVFARAGLTRTDFCEQARVLSGRASGYTARSGKLANAPLVELDQFGLGGGICSTARDLITWRRALAEGLVVSPASVRMMMRSHILPDGRHTWYGFGMIRTDLDGHALVGHNGGTPGFAAQMNHYPDDHLTIVVLANNDTGGALVVERQLAVALLGLKPHIPARGPVDSLEPYAGVYARPDGSRIELVVDGDTLAIVGRKLRRLLALGGGAFAEADHSRHLWFRGDVLVIDGFGMRLELERVKK